MTDWSLCKNCGAWSNTQLSDKQLFKDAKFCNTCRKLLTDKKYATEEFDPQRKQFLMNQEEKKLFYQAVKDLLWRLYLRENSINVPLYVRLRNGFLEEAEKNSQRRRILQEEISSLHLKYEKPEASTPESKEWLAKKRQEYAAAVKKQDEIVTALNLFRDKIRSRERECESWRTKKAWEPANICDRWMQLTEKIPAELFLGSNVLPRAGKSIYDVGYIYRKPTQREIQEWNEKYGT